MDIRQTLQDMEAIAKNLSDQLNEQLGQDNLMA
jgi:hypothetical protein